MLASAYLLLLAAWTFTAHPQLDPSKYSWYQFPAADFAGSIPIGNGRLAAAIWGTIVENITLNENSIWSGPFQDRVNPDAYTGFLDARSLLEQENMTGAGEVTLSDMASIPTSPREYHPLGELVLDFNHDAASITNYTRREYIASHPGGVFAVQLTASKPGSLNVTCSLAMDRYLVTNTASAINGTGLLRLRAKTGDMEDPIRFTSEARVTSQAGRISSNSTAIVVKAATSVEIFFDTRTSYRQASEPEWEAEVDRKLTQAARQGYTRIQKEATADYRALMKRVDLNLGSSRSAGHLPTNTRLENYKSDPDSDPELVSLMFNLGRHSLIASSRATQSPGLPANLQGIWNQDYSPAWGGKYTVDVNLQMNYWPAEVTNLADTFDPFIDLLETVVPHGADVARRMYQCDNGGYILHHNTDLWGDAAPVDNGTTWTMWPMGSAWLLQNLMDHYHFTQDKELGPSLSPENAFIVPSDMNVAGKAEGIDIAPTMDNLLLHDLFSAVIKTAEVLDITGPDVEKAQTYMAKIKPPQIGSFGQILEWRREYEEKAPDHRHMSPLVGLYPGAQLTPLVNETLADAAKVLLDRRIEHGSGSTGWSRTWTMNLYARLFDADAAWNHTQVFLQTYPSANLWNTDSGPGSAFQIDGNFGFTAGVAEMLLQSHKVLHLLPALPSAVPTGHVSGLVARGNFVVDIDWADGVLTQATIKARSGGQLEVQVQDGFPVTVNEKEYTGPVATSPGESYKIVVDS